MFCDIFNQLENIVFIFGNYALVICKPQPRLARDTGDIVGLKCWNWTYDVFLENANPSVQLLVCSFVCFC